jgi:hypothetical protein
VRASCPPPAAYSPYFLGWDASNWVQPVGGSACIHHPLGDTKKIAYTQQALVDGQFLIDDPTHYLATWDVGAMEYGSSGGWVGGCWAGLAQPARLSPREKGRPARQELFSFSASALALVGRLASRPTGWHVTTVWTTPSASDGQHVHNLHPRSLYALQQVLA